MGQSFQGEMGNLERGPLEEVGGGNKGVRFWNSEKQGTELKDRRKKER